MRDKKGYLKSKSHKELYSMATKHKIFNRELLSTDKLIEAVYRPKRYNEIAVRKYLMDRFGLHHKSFVMGNYIKWHSPWLGHACTGRYEGVRSDGRIMVAWKWQDKWVKGTVDPKNVLDFQDRRYHGYGS